jgi:NHL repeat
MAMLAVRRVLIRSGSLDSHVNKQNLHGLGWTNPAGVAVDGSGNVFVGDTGNSAVNEIAVSNPSSLTFTQTAVDMRSHSLGNGYVRSCFFFPTKGNAPDRLQALLLSVVAI